VFRDFLVGIFVLSLAASPGSARAEEARTHFQFSFGPGKASPGFIQVRPTTVYSKERGYGFDLGAKVSAVDRGGEDALRGGFCTSDQPFFFSVALPEGNYNVTLTLGDQKGESTTTVKAESRRLMLEKVHTEAGQFQTRTFTVNLRTPAIASGGQVRLKDREKGVLHWDDKLTLEFGGPRPCVFTLEITRVKNAITLYVAGDSTVTDQTREPWGGWGQMLPRFFKAGVAIANHAESGESLKSFVAEKRLEKVLSTMKAGDYLFIQFGHNDQKERGANVGAFTTYKASLKLFIAKTRKLGGIPVLVTPIARRFFEGEGTIRNTLGDYPQAVREVAAEEKVALIDLNARSARFYESLGPEKSKTAFVGNDNTHTNAYGALELARCVADAIGESKLDLAKYLVDEVRK
jgi:lysophospholipase L1-like esterase